MVDQTVFHHCLDNGLVLIGESMPWLESAAYAFSLPAGCRFDLPDKLGLANLTCEMAQRGCGNRTSRQVVEALEWLGVDDSSNVSVYSTRFSGAMPADALVELLPILSDLVRRPTLPPEQLDDARLSCLQEVRAIEDDLSHKLMIEARRRRYGDVLGRHSAGTVESLEAISIDDVAAFQTKQYQPAGAILSVAGKIDWPKIVEAVEQYFGDWQENPAPMDSAMAGANGEHHIEFDSQQTHIAVTFDSLPYSDPEYFLARAATGVLSGGTSSRLYTEVREKRGLCYSVNASLGGTLDRGVVIGYAGTTAPRAQETLDVMVDQFAALNHGITQAELDRVKVQIRSALIMQQESSMARASSNAGDWFHLNRIRSRDEINEIVQSWTVNGVNEFLTRRPFQNFDLITLGQQSLKKPVVAAANLQSVSGST